MHILSPRGAQLWASSHSTNSTISSHGVLPQGDFFARTASTASIKWTFDHIDPHTVSNIARLRPGAYLEELWELLGIVFDPDFALTGDGMETNHKRRRKCVSQPWNTNVPSSTSNCSNKKFGSRRDLRDHLRDRLLATELKTINNQHLILHGTLWMCSMLQKHLA
jgi:hypothetical protein